MGESTRWGAPTVAAIAASRLGPLLVVVWLFLLLLPLMEGWSRRDEPRGVLGIVCTLAFAAVYLSWWLRAGADRPPVLSAPPGLWSLAYVGTLAVLGALTVWCVGEAGLACVVYLSVACVAVLPLRVSAPAVVGLVVATLAVGALEDWDSQLGSAFGAMAASLAALGLRALLTRSDPAGDDEGEARLAVDNERTRFARDLHDILGHSLTVITVKAELAQKLLDVDLERARTEIADLEQLGRDAFVDVRRAVEGYRDITLPGELVRARVALMAAEIDAELPTSADEVPPELHELFAWTVREGVTNVIRHSGARRCEIRLTSSSAEVRDDGEAKPAPDGHGSGLSGLRERAFDVGATVVTRELSPGFSLCVARH